MRNAPRTTSSSPWGAPGLADHHDACCYSLQCFSSWPGVYLPLILLLIWASLVLELDKLGRCLEKERRELLRDRFWILSADGIHPLSGMGLDLF